MPLISSRKSLGVLLIASIFINVCLASGILILYTQNYSLKNNNEELIGQIQALRQEYNLILSQLDYYKAQAEFYSSLMKSKETSRGILGSASVNIVAVKAMRSDLFEVKYEGAVLNANIELIPGDGRVLINTQPRIGIDLQTSARTAAHVSENFTGITLRKTDIVLTITANEEIEVVDGPSAGAAITLAIIASIQNRSIDKSVFLTGTIGYDGSIGKVGGIIEKGIAAAKQGAKKFLVPEGQSRVQIFVPKESELFPGFVIITYEERTVNVQNYLNEQGYDVEVIEVKNVLEVYRIMVK
ncbi:MAG: S16 family serine protease [Candidatus Bathyarchaeia archaeon]